MTYDWWHPMSLRHPVFANTSQTCIHILCSTNLSRTHPLVYTCIHIQTYTYRVYIFIHTHIQLAQNTFKSDIFIQTHMRTSTYVLAHTNISQTNISHANISFTKFPHTNILHTDMSHTNISHTNFDVSTYHTSSSVHNRVGQLRCVCVRCVHIHLHTQTFYVLIFEYTHIATSREHIQVGQIRSSHFSAHISYNFRRTHSSRTCLHTHLHTDTYSRICIRANEYLICTHSQYTLRHTRIVRLPQNTFWHTHVLYDFNRTHTSQIAQMKEFFGGSQIWIPNMSNLQPPLQMFQSCRCVCVSMCGCVGVCALIGACAFVCVCGAGFALWVPTFSNWQHPWQITGVW